MRLNGSSRNPPRPCEACGAARPRPIHRQRFARFDDDSSMAGYLVVACADCGFVYADDLPGQETFDRYYRELSKYESHDTGGDVAPWAAAIHRSIVAEVSARLPDRQARILDVGAASGHLLAAFREAGFENVAGFDPSPLCSRLALERYGIRIITEPISKMALGGERFDLVLLASVLEHLRDVGGAIRGLRELLAPGGAIWFEVPDAARFAQHVHSPFHQFSLEHINFFTPASLRRLMRRHGFEAIDSWPTTRHINAMADPGIDGLFVWRDVPPSQERDDPGAIAVRRYVDASTSLEAELCARVAALARESADVIVWGTGSLTMHLLTLDAFRALRVRRFVDANRNYQGKTIGGIPVIAPEEVASQPGTILVASHASEAEIVASIRSRFRLENEVFGLVSGVRTAALTG
jgi:2-polyprenyl-3-methyl-5-hydroxy-6-metoxy-1,4-benzoquinol methylase